MNLDVIEEFSADYGVIPAVNLDPGINTLTPRPSPIKK
jgi:hypothetical protein